MRRLTFLILLLASTAAAASARASDGVGAEFFESRVRPVLVERCYKCHSAESEKLKGGLLVDSREGLLKGGDSGPAVVPGHPERSRLVEAVSYHNVDLQMPPKAKLPERQIADLTEWVKQGAPWPDSPDKAVGGAARVEAFDLAKRKAEHWAWQPIRSAHVPPVKDAGWVNDSLDAFILARLEEKGLAPAPPADKRALIRRVTFDLTGLPPTPEEVSAFVADESPDAFARVVDRLLASPHFGERWGRHWLDLVRYAETRGHEFDYEIPGAWHYRDYVIRAFNADVPYDRFVTEHIAGDLLPEPRIDPKTRVNESLLATGFWFLGEWLHSPVDIRQDEADRVDNQLDVFGKAFLGLTIACARCHDHKFDAIGTKDYYALAGFLHSSSYRDARFQWQAHNVKVARRLKALEDETRPKVLRAFIDARRPALGRVADYLLASREVIRGTSAEPNGLDAKTLGAWVEELKKAKEDAGHPLHPFALLTQHEGSAVGLLQQAVERRQTADAHPKGAKPSVVVNYNHPRPGDWIADGFAFGDGPTKPGRVTLGTDAARPVVAVSDRCVAHSALIDGKLPGLLRTPTFTITGPKLWIRVAGSGRAFVVIDSHRMIEGPLHGVSKQTIKAGTDFTWHQADLSPYVGQRAHVEFTAGEPRGWIAVAGVWQGEKPPDDEWGDESNQLLRRSLLDPMPQSADELARRYQGLLTDTAERLASDHLAEGEHPADRARLADWLVCHPALFGYDQDAQATVARLLASYQEQRHAILSDFKDSPTAPAMLDANGVDEYVFIRGSHKNRGETVPRRFLEAVAGPTQPTIERGSGRLQLARQVASPDNPLTARVMVNRVWHHLFGRGIVASTDNFGVLGQPPTHPELLDHLAGRFVHEGWSVKRLIRAIVLSSTYQMSSRPDARGDEIDPENLLLHRANVRRLEAEAIRDAVLAVSGRLDRTPYGPGVEVHLTPFMEGRGRPKQSGPLDGAGRRSVYTKVRRNFLPPMMLAFDAPAPFSTMGRRSVSNVPAQALILMNDPFVSQQAKLWAERVLAEKGLTPEQRVKRMYESAFARPPSETEVAEALAFIEGHGEALGIPAPERAADVRVWADLAHVLMNVKEFIFLN